MDREFVEGLASGEPAPGGGAACAYVGVLATSLASMVGNFTVGRKKYEKVWDQAQQHLDELETMRERLIQLVDEDERVFGIVSSAYRMPHETDEQKAARSEAIQASLYSACEVPLEVMRIAVQTADAARFMAYYGNRSVLSDAGSAASFAKAAAHGASLAVIVNVRNMKSWDRAHAYQLEMDRLLAAVDDCADSVERYVVEHIE